MGKSLNPYRAALGLQDLDVPALVKAGELNKRTGIIAALVEHGAPMPLEAIAERLVACGMGDAPETLLKGLRKAWGGSDALRKQKDGTIALDPNASDATYFQVIVSLATQEADAEPDPEPVELPPDTQPITREELDEAFEDASLNDLSGAKLAALVTEAHGRPMDIEAINAYVAKRTEHFHPLVDPRKGTARSALVTLLHDGRLVVNADAKGMLALRNRLRRSLRRKRDWARSRAASGRAFDSYMQERAVARMEVLARRRRLLHVYPLDGKPTLAGHIDPTTNEAPTIVQGEALEGTAWLPDCDVLIAVDVFDLVERLGIDPGHCRLVDLGPPQKTKSQGPRRKPLALTTDLLLRNSLGRWARLASRTKIKQLAGTKARGALAEAMAEDLATLRTFYWFGVRHRRLEAVYGAPEMQVAVAFAEAGDATMGEAAQELVGHTVRLRARGQAMSDEPLEFVGELTHANWRTLTVHTNELIVQCPLPEILELESLHDGRQGT